MAAPETFACVEEAMPPAISSTRWLEGLAPEAHLADNDSPKFLSHCAISFLSVRPNHIHEGLHPHIVRFLPAKPCTRGLRHGRGPARCFSREGGPAPVQHDLEPGRHRTRLPGCARVGHG